MAAQKHSNAGFALFLVIAFVLYACLVYVLFPHRDQSAPAHASLGGGLAAMDARGSQS